MIFLTIIIKVSEEEYNKEDKVPKKSFAEFNFLIMSGDYET